MHYANAQQEYSQYTIGSMLYIAFRPNKNHLNLFEVHFHLIKGCLKNI
jgi:hypothetical protein